MLGRQELQRDLLESFGIAKVSKDHFLMKINEVIDWKPVQKDLEDLYRSSEGRPSYPPLVLFKALLLAQFYNLSDPELEEQVKDRLSFQKFLGLSISEEVPDETTYCRFRKRLNEAGLFQALFHKVNGQLETKGLLLKRGSIVDATLIPSRNKKSDPEGKWTYQKEKATFGYKVHASCEEENQLVQDLEVTPANTHDSKMMETVLPHGVMRVYGDKAYDSKRRKREFRENGIAYRILRRAFRYRPLTVMEKSRNRYLSKLRCGIERVFAHWKEILGFKEARYRGLKKNRSHAFLLATAYNLMRSVRLVAVSGT